MAYGLALMIGLVAGLRAMTGAAAAAWAAYLGHVPVDGTWLGWLASPWAVGILTALALGEVVTDQLPMTPSRTVPVQFGTRIVVGAVAGATFGLAGGSAVIGAVAGAVGAVAGTLGGAGARARLAAYLGRDRPAALIEDAAAVVLAAAAVLTLK
ncbi:DUF4126 family protein [Methylobacterium sp. WL64]|uniref:DUF4126 family protein n=1 Tax=Methylobacterium sp. WL64 TaxID=2603894 RepID=UPI001650C7AF|nr:DUF4126 family protein [Methylobacterium sp. WL64]